LYFKDLIPSISDLFVHNGGGHFFFVKIINTKYVVEKAFWANQYLWLIAVVVTLIATVHVSKT